MSIEAYTDGKSLLFTRRNLPPVIEVVPEPIAGLGPRQLQWLEARFPGISRNRVSRLADHERASAAYRLAQYVDETRSTRETV